MRASAALLKPTFPKTLELCPSAGAAAFGVGERKIPLSAHAPKCPTNSSEVVK